jgi:hypothetical protein
MRFMMVMIPRVYQPDTAPGRKAQEGYVPPAEAVARMRQFNEELVKAGVLIASTGFTQVREARVSRVSVASPV